MEASPSMRPSRPLSIKELTTQAENFSFNTRIPFKQWVHAAETLYQEATFALSDGDYARAYIMLYRHSVLVLQLLPTHPQYKDPDGRKAFRPLAKRVESVLKDCEQLKPEIEHAYNEWERMKPATSEKAQERGAARTYADYAARDPTLTGNAKILDASEHQDLAVSLAQQEITRRDTARRATRQAGLSDEETSARRRAGAWDDWERRGYSDPNDLQRQMEAARRNLNTASERRRDDSTERPVAHHYSYPTISRSQPVDYQRASVGPGQPSRPPKELIRPSRDDTPSLPPKVDRPTPHVPRKVPLDNYRPLVPDSNYPTNDLPHRPPKESLEAPPLPKKERERVTFKPGAYLENGDPMRSIFIPSTLRKRFLEIAEKNTKAGVEMCGMLCGEAANNVLYIRCLLIPEQTCTPDTCETVNESDMFDYCISQDLMIIGWIHTHPTQTCFMSSRDLHTHAGYQVMMPESVAIVCAPKFTPSYGIFRLTNPPGLNHILDCNHADTFHQHSINNLYREADHPHGHVFESDQMDFYVHDLRPS